MTLTKFLRARIAEDEAAVRDEIAHDADRDATRWGSSRVLAECEAKRRIVQVCEVAIDVASYAEARNLADLVLTRLTLPYANHPDCREEWRP